MERTQIYLRKSQAKKLKELAHKKGSTLSGMVRDAIDVQYGMHLARPMKKQEKFESLLDAAKRINKLGPPGPKDLASRVDEYLYGEI